MIPRLHLRTGLCLLACLSNVACLLIFRACIYIRHSSIRSRSTTTMGGLDHTFRQSICHRRIAEVIRHHLPCSRCRGLYAQQRSRPHPPRAFRHAMSDRQACETCPQALANCAEEATTSPDSPAPEEVQWKSAASTAAMSRRTIPPPGHAPRNPGTVAADRASTAILS